MVTTKQNVSMNNEIFERYFDKLINQFFKILPIHENEEATLETYIDSLQIELLGLKDLIPELTADPMLLRLISILQYFKEHPDCKRGRLRREVFKAIDICDKLKATYSESEVESNE